MELLMNDNCENRALDDIDVREEETSASGTPELRIEFATFTEGEYIESILINRVRAKEIHVDLGKLLGAEPELEATRAESMARFSPRETATMLAALRYWQREGLMSAGAEQDIAVDGGRFCALSAEEIDDLSEIFNF
jgi:hypothetical protein